ncbi:MAG: epoxyqueuosine reductase QueH [Bacteroidales bacterium]|nr:epoxyqueuosine reductase QueH [Bacteroidales bacterium]
MPEKLKLKLNIPGCASEVMLHSCCAPCSVAIAECLIDNNIKPTVFYYNPNIYPREEYEIRKAENIRMTQSLGIQYIDGDYDHYGWLQLTKELRHEPEGGKRCLLCFKIRLIETARYAHNNGFSVFTTTLASSRWKSLEQITEAGRYAAGLYPDLMFWEQNWRKYGLTERRKELTERYDFYNQQYCGCEFSLRDSNKWRKLHGRPLIQQAGPDKDMGATI